MSGHTVTPYDLAATRAHARKDKDVKLILSSLSDKTAVDLLDVVDDHITLVEPINSSPTSRGIECVLSERDGDKVWLVFASDHMGQRELVQDGDDPLRPAVFEKNRKHITRYFSIALLWRSPDDSSGILLIHSPWGRGGTRSQIVTLLQRAVAQAPDAKAKLHADPRIPASVLRRIIANAKSTRITYLRDTGVQSTFGDRSGKKSAPASMAVIVKGSKGAAVP